MKIPEGLMPNRVAAMLGVSVGQLAVELKCSYHLLHGWSRRGSAPAHTLRWLEVEIGKILERKRQEIAAIKDPVDRAIAISQVPALAIQQGTIAAASGLTEVEPRAAALTRGGRK
jgi:hypothetical protein